MSERRLPGLGTVFVAQFVHLMKSWYVPTVLVMPLLGLWWTYRNLRPSYMDDQPWFRYPVLASATGYLLFVGLLAGVIVWLSESPSRRRYHWSLPIRREVHDLSRVTAGACWLFLAGCLFIAIGYLVEPQANVQNYLRYTRSYWIVSLLVMLLVYFMASIASLLWDKALFWVALIVVGGTMIDTPWMRRDLPFVLELRRTITAYDEPLTLGRAMIGPESSSPWRDKNHRLRVFNATNSAYYKRVLGAGAPPGFIRQRRADDLARLQRMRGPDWYDRQRGAWGPAITLWYVLTFCGVFLAVRRRPNV